MARSIRLLALVALAVAFAATEAPSVQAQEGAAPKVSATKKKKKKKKKKKPAAGKPVDVGDLDEPAPAPTGAATGATTPAPAPASSAPAAESKEDADEDGDADKEKGKDDKNDKPGGVLDRSRPITAALLMGVGVSSTACGTGTCNAYGFGLGLRGGYTLRSNLYVGGTIVYHLGYNKQTAVGTLTRGFTGGVAYLGPEVGYDLVAGPLLVRPYGGIGIGIYRQTDTGFGANAQPLDAGGARFSFWPGVAAMYPVSPSFFVGADARFVLIASGSSGFSVFATGGMRL